MINDKFKDLLRLAESNKEKYQAAEPFAHIVYDDFFNETFLNEVLNEFPDLAVVGGRKFEDKLQVKFAGQGEKYFGENTKRLMHFLNSEPFINFLQVLTGIDEPLIGDPYFLGAGQHEIKKGGLLKIHADFNIHDVLKLDRRINVLVYLNQDWKEEYGGHFELWDETMEKCREKILPHFNRLVIFSTTDFSYHGHPDPLNCPENMSRKSLALYYYSNGRPENEIIKGQEMHYTLFKDRKGNDIDKEAFKREISLKGMIKDFIPPIILKSIRYLKTGTYQ